jgi:outer membrane murein-binding lipoprotein Lpp
MKSIRKNIITIVIAVLIAVMPSGAFGSDSASGKAKPSDKLAKATTDLVTAINQYKTSVEALIPMYEAALKSANEALEKRKELYAQGIVSKRDVETGELAVKEAQARLDQSRKQIVESDQLVAEAKAEKELPGLKSSGRGGYVASSAILRYGGTSGWTLSRASQVQSFFASRFGRTLPVSAFGQSSTHNRMGFNHSNSMDIAVHPDSAEGKALIAYLRSNGIPFLAFRSAVRGAATGAHIHIGYPSHRI